jgi:hypothetical protein
MDKRVYTMAKFLHKIFNLPSLSKVFKRSSSLQNSILSGRWALDYDGSVQGRKVYWANMDNCGCCHHVYAKIVKNKDRAEDDDDEHILPYII